MYRKKNIDRLVSYIPETMRQFLPLEHIPLKAIPAEYISVVDLEGAVSHAFRWPFSTSVDIVTGNPAFYPADYGDTGIGLFCVHGAEGGNSSFSLITKNLISNLPKEISNVYQVSSACHMQGKSIYHYADELHQKIIASGHKKVFLTGHDRGGLVAALVAERLVQRNTGIEVLGVITVCSPFGGAVTAKERLTWISASAKQMQVNRDFQAELHEMLDKSLTRYLFFIAESDFVVSHEASYTFKDGAKVILLPEDGHLSATTSETVVEHIQNFILDSLPEYQISFEEPCAARMTEGKGLLDLIIDESERIVFEKGVFLRIRLSNDPEKDVLKDEVRKFNRFEVSRLVPLLAHPGLRKAFFKKLQMQPDEIKDFVSIYIDACFKQSEPLKYQQIKLDLEIMRYKHEAERLKKITGNKNCGKKSKNAAQDVLIEVEHLLKSAAQNRDVYLPLITRILQCTSRAIESPKDKVNMDLYRHYYDTLRQMQNQAFETKSALEGKFALLANALESVVWLRVPSKETPIFDICIKLVDKFIEKMTRERFKLSSQYKKTWSKRVRQNRLDKVALLDKLIRKLEHFKNDYAVNIDSSNYVKDFINEIGDLKEQLSDIEQMGRGKGHFKNDSSATKLAADFLDEMIKIENKFTSDIHEPIVSLVRR